MCVYILSIFLPILTKVGQTDSTGQTGVFFQKRLKISCNIKICVSTHFYTKRSTFTTNAFHPGYTVFTLVESDMCTHPYFRALHLVFNVLYQKNNRKFGQNGTFSQGALPGERTSFLQKWQKILCNINLHTVAVIYRKVTKFPKKFFGQIATIFTHEDQCAHISSFLCTTSVTWW